MRVAMLSTRWIDFCIERKFVLKDPVKEKMFWLIPFPIKTPVPSFDKIKISVVGFDLQMLKSLRETARIMGFDENEDTRYSDIVVLEKSKYKLCVDKKGNLLDSCPESLKGKVIRNETWLVKLINTGKLKDADMKSLEGLVANKE